MIVPSFVIILLVAIFFADIRQNRLIDAAFKGMRPAVVALIVAPIVGLTKGMQGATIAIAAVVALVVWYFGFSPVWFLLAGALAGILWATRQGKEAER